MTFLPGAKYIPEHRNFNSVYIVLKFLSASSVYQRRDVLCSSRYLNPFASVVKISPNRNKSFVKLLNSHNEIMFCEQP